MLALQPSQNSDRWLWVPAQRFAWPGRRLNLKYLPRLECDKFFARNLCLIERLVQRHHRCVDRFIGQWIGAVMMRERLRRAAIGQRFYRVRRVHVLILHEPARLIGTDRQDCEPQWTMRLRDTAKMLAVAIAGIADDVELACGSLQHKTRPQRLVAVEQAARRPMPCRHQRHRDATAEFDAVAPVERLGTDRLVSVAHGDVVAEWRDHPRGKFCVKL